MDTANQSLPHHSNAAHFLEGSQSHKHFQKSDSDLQQDKHSQVYYNVLMSFHGITDHFPNLDFARADF